MSLEIRASSRCGSTVACKANASGRFEIQTGALGLIGDPLIVMWAASEDLLLQRAKETLLHMLTTSYSRDVSRQVILFLLLNSA